MMKNKRRPIIREHLEAQLKKNERRMQAISEESYKLRQALEQLDATPKQTPLTKEARAEIEKAQEAKDRDAEIAHNQSQESNKDIEEPIEQKEQTDAIPAGGTQEGSEVGAEAGK